MAITEYYATSAGTGAKNGSITDPWGWAEMLAADPATLGPIRINFKGDHTLTGAATFTGTMSATNFLILRGYNSSIGDLSTRARASGHGALSTTNVPVITGGGSVFNLPAWGVLEDLVLTGNRNGSVVALGTSSTIVRCTITHLDTDASGSAVASSTGPYSLVYDSDLILSGASGNLAAGSFTVAVTVYGCRIDGGAAAGLNIVAGCVVAHCVVHSSGTDAILINSASNNVVIINNTLVSSGSDGIHQITGGTRTAHIVGNLITDQTGYGIYSVDAAAGLIALNNRIVRNNSDDAQTEGATDWLAALAQHNNATAATQANEYENAGGNDYRLKSTSPALSIGIPLYRDVGALQRIRDYPAVGNVTEDDTVDGATGTYHEATAAEVQSGVQFGAGGTEYTGTLTGGGGGRPELRQGNL